MPHPGQQCHASQPVGQQVQWVSYGPGQIEGRDPLPEEAAQEQKDGGRHRGKGRAPEYQQPAAEEEHHQRSRQYVGPVAGEHHPDPALGPGQKNEAVEKVEQDDDRRRCQKMGQRIPYRKERITTAPMMPAITAATVPPKPRPLASSAH